MPRQSRGRPAAPARPSAAPARASAPAQQTRQSSTAAHPQQRAQTQTQAPRQQGSGSGLFGQMASTAAGVAVGSTIGHTLGGFFGGGSSAAPPADAEQVQTQSSQYTTQESAVCAGEIGSFRKCMDQNQGDLTICGWYLDQLKACQQAARPY